MQAALHPADNLVTRLTINFPERRQDQRVRVIENRAAVCEAEAMLSAVRRVLDRIKVNLHAPIIRKTRSHRKPGGKACHDPRP